jgi:hypothetical protein
VGLCVCGSWAGGPDDSALCVGFFAPAVPGVGRVGSGPDFGASCGGNGAFGRIVVERLAPSVGLVDGRRDWAQ